MKQEYLWIFAEILNAAQSALPIYLTVEQKAGDVDGLGMQLERLSILRRK